jgi:hypothetical protein
MDTNRYNSVIKPTGMTASNTSNSPAFCWTPDNGGAATKKTRITDDMFARIPALLLAGTTKAEIATMYGVTLNTLVVLCSRRGVSLRKGGSLPKRTNLTLPRRGFLTAGAKRPSIRGASDKPS